MTRRERLERKLEKRAEWAASRDRKAAAGFKRAETIAHGIPMGQPILVGHHSERHHRKDLERMDAGMRAGVESSAMAEHHRSKADGLERQLEGSIFSDDPDAVPALEARIADLEEKRAHLVALRKAWKKAGKPAADNLEGWTKVAELVGCELSELAGRRMDLARFSWHDSPVPAYETQNLGGNIGRLRKRLEDVKARQERTAAAEASPDGFVIEGGAEWVTVTFPERPSAAILDGLRGAGFRWSGGSWHGKRRDAERVLGVKCSDCNGVGQTPTITGEYGPCPTCRPA